VSDAPLPVDAPECLQRLGLPPAPVERFPGSSTAPSPVVTRRGQGPELDHAHSGGTTRPSRPIICTKRAITASAGSPHHGYMPHGLAGPIPSPFGPAWQHNVLSGRPVVLPLRNGPLRNGPRQLGPGERGLRDDAASLIGERPPGRQFGFRAGLPRSGRPRRSPPPHTGPPGSGRARRSPPPGRG
jgi:hypothetical protein